MEQIYTIPVNEAFEASAADHALGCPFCAIYNKLEENELDLILGASMMEPDIRIRTNEQGFCRTHYDMMFVRKNRLGMALTLESHLDELRREIKGNAAKSAKRIDKLEHSCYVCDRIAFTLSTWWARRCCFGTRMRISPPSSRPSPTSVCRTIKSCCSTVRVACPRKRSTPLSTIARRWS